MYYRLLDLGYRGTGAGQWDGGFHGTTHRTVATVCNGDQEVPAALLFLHDKSWIQNTKLFEVSGSEY